MWPGLWLFIRRVLLYQPSHLRDTAYHHKWRTLGSRRTPAGVLRVQEFLPQGAKCGFCADCKMRADTAPQTQRCRWCLRRCRARTSGVVTCSSRRCLCRPRLRKALNAVRAWHLPHSAVDAVDLYSLEENCSRLTVRAQRRRERPGPEDNGIVRDMR